MMVELREKLLIICYHLKNKLVAWNQPVQKSQFFPSGPLCIAKKLFSLQTKECPHPFHCAGLALAASCNLPFSHSVISDCTVLGSRLSGREAGWLQDPEATVCYADQVFVLTTNVNLVSDDCGSLRIVPNPSKLLSSIIFRNCYFS